MGMKQRQRPPSRFDYTRPPPPIDDGEVWKALSEVQLKLLHDVPAKKFMVLGHNETGYFHQLWDRGLIKSTNSRVSEPHWMLLDAGRDAVQEWLDKKLPVYELSDTDRKIIDAQRQMIGTMEAAQPREARDIDKMVSKSDDVEKKCIEEEDPDPPRRDDLDHFQRHMFGDLAVGFQGCRIGYDEGWRVEIVDGVRGVFRMVRVTEDGYKGAMKHMWQCMDRLCGMCNVYREQWPWLPATEASFRA